MSNETCGTGTGEPYTRQQPRIADRCPTCGAQSLFIGSGGWLTCSVIGCKEPGVSRAIKRLTRERDDERERAQHNMDMARDYTGELWSARCGRAELALAASQAECEKLREELERLHGAAFGLLEATSDMTCEHDPHANTVCPHGYARSRVQSMCRAARSALSRPPGSREALRAMLCECIAFARQAHDISEPTERDPRFDWDHTAEAIVARLLGEGGDRE